MKFEVLYKHDKEVLHYYKKSKSKGYGRLIKLLGLKEYSIYDDHLKRFIDDAYVFQCKAPAIVYLVHKARFGKYAHHRRGWH